MRKEIKTLAAPFKTCFWGVLAIAAASLCIYYLVQNLAEAAALCGFLALLFLGFFLYLFRSVRVDVQGVYWRGLFARGRYAWTELEEVGVLGERVFPKTKTNNGGTKYIYFSTETLTDAKRFDLALHWPVKAVPYIPYNARHYETVSFLWQKPFCAYNVGKLAVGQMHPGKKDVYSTEE